MPRKPVTDRSLKAQKTRKKLFQSAAKLIENNGYENVTVEEICKKSGVSVGAFYHYFNSKTDIIVEFFKQIDYFFEETVANEFGNDASGNIDVFFRYYAQFHVDQGVEHTSMILKVQGDFFNDKTRFMYTKLFELVEKAAAEGKFGKKPDPALVVDYLLVVARGLLFDWALVHGEHDLVEKMGNYIKIAKKAFI